MFILVKELILLLVLEDCFNYDKEIIKDLFFFKDKDVFE